MVRTIRNVLPSGDMILFPDPAARKLVWQLAYNALPSSDLQALTSFFAACSGPLHAFTFIDPTDNMLSASADLTNPAWDTSSFITVSGSAADPFGGSSAFVLTNAGQASALITQTLAIPAGDQYCFSLYVASAQASQLSLLRLGAASQAVNTYSVAAEWGRIVSAGSLSDAGETFTVGVQLSAGQQITLYGLQLEAQIAPSRYRFTTSNGGVYPAAHWGVDQLPVTAEAPDLFATAFTIETPIQD